MIRTTQREGDAVPIAVALLSLTRVQAHPHRQREPILRRDRSAHCLHRRPEHCADPVAGVLEHLASVLDDHGAQHLVMSRQLTRHVLRICRPPPR